MALKKKQITYSSLALLFASILYLLIPDYSVWTKFVLLYGSIILWVALCIFLYKDAKERNRKPWLWLVLGILIGCFAGLAYLFTIRNEEE